MTATLDGRAPAAGDEGALLGALPVLRSALDSEAAEFRQNAAAMQSAVADLQERLRVAQSGGSEESVQRHRRRGKLLPRERIDLLLDPGSPFLELSPLAAWAMYDDEAPAAGIVTGIGRVCGQEVVIVAND